MDVFENLTENKVVRAYDKVEQIKKFYWFVASAIVVSFLFFGMAFFLSSVGVPNFLFWMLLAMPLVFGIVLITEYMRVFDKNLFFGKKWEERKINQYMEADQIASKKYR